MELQADAILRYGEEDAQVAVVSGRHPFHLIMIGGQGEGLMWSHHTRQLAEGLEKAGARWGSALGREEDSEVPASRPARGWRSRAA